MQPTFMPWLGYFELINSADTFVFFDTVAVNKQSWQTRNKIKAQNRELLLSLPLKGLKSNTLIKDALLDFSKYDFRVKLVKSLEQNYSKAEFYREIHPTIKELVLFETPFLGDYTLHIISQISRHLNFNTKLLRLSEVAFVSDSKKGELVLDVCKAFNADIYLSPLGSKEYLKSLEKEFIKNGVKVIYQSYSHPKYKQLGENFLPYMGIFDLLYNEGFKRSAEIIKEGKRR